jgi:hypothetical protein
LRFGIPKLGDGAACNESDLLIGHSEVQGANRVDTGINVSALAGPPSLSIRWNKAHVCIEVQPWLKHAWAHCKYVTAGILTESDVICLSIPREYLEVSLAGLRGISSLNVESWVGLLSF